MEPWLKALIAVCITIVIVICGPFVLAAIMLAMLPPDAKAVPVNTESFTLAQLGQRAAATASSVSNTLQRRLGMESAAH